MNKDLEQTLKHDTDGLLAYEYMANHIESIASFEEAIVNHLIEVDKTGQLLVSAARYLNAIDPKAHAKSIKSLIETAIDRDRERRYIPDLLSALWGEDYEQHATELSAADNNFRRIYKRVKPTSTI
jgi:hypothetical protein